ncbi:hypothetical protein [Halomonas colorata]|uniref:hypothetical protein n=1 Tax=Halomonas colorata TaxID=2742615 RepID=UPI001868B0BC|nr:hypothetical protein [Halomonas colorata]
MIPTFDEMSYDEGFGAELQCPNCKGNYLHHDRVEIFERQEDAKTGIHVTVENGSSVQDTSMAGNPSTRRHGLNIFFWCEFCDAVPVLTIAQHKGNTLVDMDFTIDKNKKRDLP